MNGEDQLLKSLFAEGKEIPTSSISEKVMQHIEKSSEVFEYKPLIGKKAWIIIGSTFSAIMIYLISESTDTAALKTPELVTLLGSGFLKLKSSFSLEIGQIRIPQIPSTLLTAMVALIIVGVYLMFSYKWSRRMFR